ncbi:MAG: hypothetical protein LBQ60_18795 [Bacteroidales bacterium]|jgi:hypothetical protein|nr:hypothetical protein [Bacteroidales bacterium]
MNEISSKDLDKLESLIKSRQFPELSADEQQWVLQYLDEDEYRKMASWYGFLSDEKDQVDEIEPSLSSKLKLDAVLKQSGSKEKAGFFSRRIPVYRSVAASVIFFLLGMGVQFFIPPKGSDAQNFKTIMQNMPEERMEPKDTFTGYQEILALKNPEMLDLKTLAEYNVQQVRKTSNGRSLGNDSVVQKLLVTIN